MCLLIAGLLIWNGAANSPIVVLLWYESSQKAPACAIGESKIYAVKFLSGSHEMIV